MDIKEYIKCFFQNEYEGIWFGQEKIFFTVYGNQSLNLFAKTSLIIGHFKHAGGIVLLISIFSFIYSNETIPFKWHRLCI